MSQSIAIRKNSREQLHVSLDDFRGHRLVNLRVWYEAEDGEMRPGKQGLAIRIELLPDLRAALDAVGGTEPAATVIAAWSRGTPDEKREIWSRVFQARHSDPVLAEVDKWTADAFEDATDGQE